MALIVVGGQTKHVGKTTLVCNIIRHFASARWTAAKITSHLHAADDCRPVACGTGWNICEQRERDSQADTARYLNAGALRSLLVCAESGKLANACSALKNQVLTGGNVIVESTAAAELLAPDLFLLVVNPDSQEFKASASEHLAHAHTLVVSAEAGNRRLAELPDLPTFRNLENGFDARLGSMIEKLWEDE